VWNGRSSIFQFTQWPINTKAICIEQLVVLPPGAADTMCPRPRAIINPRYPTPQAFVSWLLLRLQQQLMAHAPYTYQLVWIGSYDTLLVLPLVGGVTDLDLFTLKLMRVTARGVGNLPTNFSISGTFRSRFMAQRMSGKTLDLAAWPLTFSTCRPTPVRGIKWPSSLTLEIMAVVGDTFLNAPLTCRWLADDLGELVHARGNVSI